MTKDLIIIGAGQLGSRHLQALASCDKDFSITVVDPSEQSLQVAKSRYDEVKNEYSPEPVYSHSIPHGRRHFFMAVIATNSMHRRAVIEQLLNEADVDFLILEKFLFPSIADYEPVGELIQKRGTKAFVNTPRRMFGYYSELKSELTPPFTLTVSGVNWGLACNSIHYLDTFVHLAEDSLTEDFSFVSDGKIYDSKRPGYVEFNGVLRASTYNGCSCIIASHHTGSAPLLISIADKDAFYTIKETGGAYIEKIVSRKGDQDEIKRYEIKTPYQSVLTYELLMELNRTGNSRLPDYFTSAGMHLKLLEAYLSTYRNIRNDRSLESCPIT